MSAIDAAHAQPIPPSNDVRVDGKRGYRNHRLSGWGRVPSTFAVEVRSENLLKLSQALPLARGLGRAYGDAALPAPGEQRIGGTALADRLLEFDHNRGVLKAEAGVSLAALARVLLPRGWFTPVSPGTRFVTLGGMIAADVHGKNHHRDGTIGRHVESLTVRTGLGDVVECSPTLHADLFWATLGGMGLTGMVIDATIRMAAVPSPWIVEERQQANDLDHFIDMLQESGKNWPMTVGWIDTLSTGSELGRGILIRGRWATGDEAGDRMPRLVDRGITVPFAFPEVFLNKWVVKTFNAAHYTLHRKRSEKRIVHPWTFFYPIDVLRDWSRLYGRRGFTQYQCVLPNVVAKAATRAVLAEVSRQSSSSFLCVIKDCGAEGNGLLSFPLPGVSVALDIPFRNATQSLVDALNSIVAAAGGRIYLAKDALTRRSQIRALEPRLDKFLEIRRKWDPEMKIRSAQSVRLFGW